VVEAPFAAEAAGCFNHACRDNEGYKNLPTPARVDVRESGETLVANAPRESTMPRSLA
jgi:hypothetical protein